MFYELSNLRIDDFSSYTSGFHALRIGNTLLAEMQADYSKTVEEVYIDVVIRALLGDLEKSLITLASAQHPILPSKPGATTENGLQSWVPDWRGSEGHLMSEPVSPHHAHGNRPSQVRIDEGLFSVRGIKVDIVEVCSKTLKWKEFHYDPMRKDLAIESLWTDVCGKTSIDLQTPYTDDPDSDSAVFAYLQTLSIGGIATALRDDRRYQHIDQKKTVCAGAGVPDKGLRNIEAYFCRASRGGGRERLS